VAVTGPVTGAADNTGAAAGAGSALLYALARISRSLKLTIRSRLASPART
jgi:hypothetical protein